ncbi:putative thymidilate synthase [Escherichia phage vB_EcoP_PhAPEC5]|uniref:Putative thymidilate synthase n=1 Tax=Escherichia phage vB_EcoP_PhAPEC5 TaxID=1395983 RepID=A0A067Y0A4_9CAUD|nr:FAD-dependent thymidylate synthase [Escherichia phage vB_EcoP_PhAPEC5]AGV99310.1 putative thymidilate synthase [Escherichia phage vB_EcoP_PhAPEC5]
MIKATVIADSVHHATGTRITTFELVYPRFIHSEFMTHRVFNRNASSSRAIPTSKFIEQVRNEPVMPSHWGKNQKGMQADEELTPMEIEDAKFIWDNAASSAAVYAEQLRRGQVHKQIVNRILEPFTHIRVVVTSTSWANFYGLRDHEDAQPEIRELAQAMRKAHNESVPTKLMQGHWHMPYITDNDLYVAYDFCKHQRITRDEPSSEEVYGLLLKVSAARCARASYNNFEGRPSTIEEDLGLFAKLVENQPIHASPTEHQATPMLFGDKFINNQNPLTWEQGVTSMDREGKLYSGNLLDFIQFRKLIPGETITE